MKTLRTLNWSATSLRVALGLMLVSASGVAPLLAAPVHWRVDQGGNGHWYEAVIVSGGISWPGARDASVAKGGYLACITSAAENGFVFGLVNRPECWLSKDWGNEGPWLGGYRNANDTFDWVSGESWSYSSWYPGQPDNYNDWDDAVAFAVVVAWSSSRQATWDDIHPADLAPAYVIEYDSAPSSWTELPPGLVACYEANGSGADGSGGKASGNFTGNYVPGIQGLAFHIGSRRTTSARPPLVDPIAEATLHAGIRFSNQVIATDSDVPPNALTFSLLSKPAGMTNWTGWPSTTMPVRPPLHHGHRRGDRDLRSARGNALHPTLPAPDQRDRGAKAPFPRLGAAMSGNGAG